MGFPCLRLEGRFFASVDPKSGDLVVKLARDRVLELIENGIGREFAPNGRVFREWVAIPGALDAPWVDLVVEAREFCATA